MNKIILVAALAAFQSLPYTVLASAPADPLITPAPTPDLERRQVAGGPGTPILSTLHYSYSQLPYQVYPYPVLRGPQSGYNICNSTTEGPNSECQTLIFNSPDDFCLWGSDVENGTIGDEEARVVAYCTKPGHGTRVIPAGSITGLQWMKTSGYIQVVGFINNLGIDLAADDEGGELDPHGADLQGNPLGGMVFSNGTADANGPTPVQVYSWNTFVGGNQFCFKACYNSITSPNYCENRYDLVGCSYNMPNDAQNGTFVSCEGDLQTPVGTYVSNGQTLTWSMPASLTAPPPYTPVVPASSSCVTYQSTDLFPLVSSSVSSGAASASTPTATGTGGAGKSGASTSRTSGASSPSNTGSSGASSNNAGSSVRVPGSIIFSIIAAVLSPAFAMLL